MSGDLRPRDHVLLSLSVEVKSRSILHNYKLGYLLLKTLLSSVALNNCTRNGTEYKNNALSVWSRGYLRNSLNIQMNEIFASGWKYSLTLFCFRVQNDAPAYGGEGEIFIYFFLKVLAERE